MLAVLLAAPALPVVSLRFVDPPTSAFMLLRLGQGLPVDMRWRPLEELGSIFPVASVAAEDPNFCQEWFGFDVDRIAEEVGVWLTGGRPAGATTIAMQLARNLFLWPERGLLRKTLEAWITPSIALLLPQRRQLEIYLNVVEFGPGTFGIEAGAQYWFGIHADAVTMKQAAMLVTVLPAPHRRSPLHANPDMELVATAVQSAVEEYYWSPLLRENCPLFQ
jgi:monofunctional biosynthetic peptidoglycan transglycosylase